MRSIGSSPVAADCTRIRESWRASVASSSRWAGGLAALLVNAPPRAAVGVAQQLVKQIQQLVAALEIQLGEHSEDQRVPPRGLQARDRLRRHPRPGRHDLAPARRRQRPEVDPVGAQLQQAAIAPNLAAQLSDADTAGALL
jgi:hypothetical protein